MISLLMGVEMGFLHKEIQKMFKERPWFHYLKNKNIQVHRLSRLIDHLAKLNELPSTRVIVNVFPNTLLI